VAIKAILSSKAYGNGRHVKAFPICSPYRFNRSVCQAENVQKMFIEEMDDCHTHSGSMIIIKIVEGD
jgi:hypothetical protein